MNKKNYLKIIAILMVTLVVSLPIAFAQEYQILYDENGNMIWDEETDVYRIYNELNQLAETRINNATGTLLQKYIFDPILERVFIKDEYYPNGSLKSSTYYFDEDYIVLQNSSGVYNKTLIFADDRSLIAYEDFDGSKKYVLPDHQGGAHIVLNESGDVIEENLFSPFAEPLAGSQINPFSYEAKEYDSLVKDYNFHFRKFTPTGPPIMNQPDTLLQNIYDPQLLNRYSFERNSPYNYIDPDGHIIWTLFLIVAGAGIAYGIYDQLVNPFEPTPGATPSQIKQQRLDYSVRAGAKAATFGTFTGLSSGYTASGPVVTYSAPTVGKLLTLGATQSVITQTIEGQPFSPLRTGADALFSATVGKLFTPVARQGQFLPTSSIGNQYAVNLYYTSAIAAYWNTIYSHFSSRLSDEADKSKDTGGSGGGGGGGGGSGGTVPGDSDGDGEQDYTPVDPCDYIMSCL
jgi:hypothetical protein